MHNLNSKGQFFSQDVIIAVIIFVFSIMLFMVASQSVYSQVTLADSRNHFDESAHITLTTLVEHPGEPVGWEYGRLEDVNSFGLSKTNNVLDRKKAEMLFYYLDNNYDYARVQLGVSHFDLNLVLTDMKGNVLASAGHEKESPLAKLIYERFVYYDGNLGILQGVITVG